MHAKVSGTAPCASSCCMRSDNLNEGFPFSVVIVFITVSSTIFAALITGSTSPNLLPFVFKK